MADGFPFDAPPNSRDASRMDDRSAIYEGIRAALAPLTKRAPLPAWDPTATVCPAPGDTLIAQFRSRMERVHGTVLDDVPALAAFLRARDALFGYCAPDILSHWHATREMAALDGIVLESTFDRSRIDAYAFGITRAAGAIAESGTLILNDAVTQPRLAALAPWIHIAAVPIGSLYADIPTALRHFGDDPSVIWVTGPSKTADVEGILIEGVHGPGVQACLFLAENDFPTTS